MTDGCWLCGRGGKLKSLVAVGDSGCSRIFVLGVLSGGVTVQRGAKKTITLRESNERLHFSCQFCIYSSFENGIFHIFLWY